MSMKEKRKNATLTSRPCQFCSGTAGLACPPVFLARVFTTCRCILALNIRFLIPYFYCSYFFSLFVYFWPRCVCPCLSISVLAPFFSVVVVAVVVVFIVFLPCPPSVTCSNLSWPLPTATLYCLLNYRARQIAIQQARTCRDFVVI